MKSFLRLGPQSLGRIDKDSYSRLGAIGCKIMKLRKLPGSCKDSLADARPSGQDYLVFQLGNRLCRGSDISVEHLA